MEQVRILTARAHRLLAPMISEIGRVYRAGKPVIVLVPEQLTLQMERELMDRLGLPGFFDLQVLSPSRLTEKALERAGDDGRVPLDASGRQMAAGRAIELSESELTYYRASCQRRGFVQKLCALITDMKRGGLTPDALQDYADALPAGLGKQKASDLSKLYLAYEKTLGERFSDGEDKLRYVASRLQDSGLLEGQTLYVYGFDTLPEQLVELLLSAAPLCEKLTVGLVCDSEKAGDQALYLPARQSVARFRELLTKKGIASVQSALPIRPLPSAPAIRHLDENLFSHPAKRFVGQQQSVFLDMPDSPYEEATRAARQIMALLTQGFDPEQIALLYPAENGYRFALTAALKESGLPFYTDQKLPATSHPLPRFLLRSLGAMAQGYRNNEVLGAIKSGYSPLTFEEGCKLENYVISYGVDRARWTRPFTRGGDELASECEQLRQKLIAPMEKARAALVAARDSAGSIRAICDYLTDAAAYETLREEEKRLAESGLVARAAQAGQVWQAICGLLDQLALLQGGARIPLKYIASRLECGLGAISLASLPPGRGMLRAGELGHFLSGDMRAVFLLGLSDGLLARDTQSLLCEDEREDMQANTGAYLGVTDENRERLARLDLKRAMTLPCDLLFLSCAKTGLDGAALRPLSVLEEIRDALFSGLPRALLTEDELPLSPEQALSELSARLRRIGEGVDIALPERWERILATLLQSEAYGDAARRMVAATDYRVGAEALDAEQARALFGSDLTSISRLEDYAVCPFKHFVTFGLRPQIAKKWEIRPADTGMFYHEAMRAFAREAQKERDYPQIDEERTLRLCEMAMTPLLPELLQGPMGDGERSRATLARAQRILRRASVTMTKHLAAGRFSVCATEAAFGYEGGLPPIVLMLSDGREIMLRGRIDRVDRYEGDGGVYLRVIDYKSGQTSFDAAKAWWGLQLQLSLYLDASLALEDGAKPAGAFYFHVAQPLVETDEDVKQVAEQLIGKALMLRGVTLSDVEVLRAMDDGDEKTVLPIRTNKKGELDSRLPALGEMQMAAFLRHARRVATNLLERMLSGDVTIAPYRLGAETACDRCDYAGICGAGADDDMVARELSPMSQETLRERLDAEKDEPAKGFAGNWGENDCLKGLNHV